MPRWSDRKVGQDKGRRRGDVFSIRVTDAERAAIETAQDLTSGPRGLGPWVLWAARCAVGAGVLPARGTTRPAPLKPVVQAAESSITARIVLDLCGGSGAWSRPYAIDGYDVRLVTLPDINVLSYVPPPNVYGVLAAPPCTEFSMAKNGQDRDFAEGLRTVVACLRIIALCKPKFWALENPAGLLGLWGMWTPRLVFEPYEYGDPWTKRTAIWGDFRIPAKGPFVEPMGSAMDRKTPAERAITPPGFANAFFAANQ